MALVLESGGGDRPGVTVMGQEQARPESPQDLAVVASSRTTTHISNIITDAISKFVHITHGYMDSKAKQLIIT